MTSSDSILITSTVHRSQALNIDDCLQKVRFPFRSLIKIYFFFGALIDKKSTAQLHFLVLSASMASVKNEASTEQKQRVILLQKAEKVRRRIEKDRKSSVKQSRKKGDWD